MTNTWVFRFGLPLIVWLVVFYDSIMDMVSVWSHSKTYEHGFLIAPICVWLVWQEKDKFKASHLSTSWLAATLLAGVCLIWMVGLASDIALFEHASAIFSLQLIIWALVGNMTARAYYFPILYLVFCIPFGEELIPYLQSVTANISVWLVRLTGIPIYREGMFLAIPNGRFEVAEACSGIRFLISSIALGTLFAYIFFRKKWKFILFVVFSCILPVIANGLRAYGIIIVGYLTDMEHATGADHLVYGWLFFCLVTTISFSIAYYLRDKTALQHSIGSVTAPNMQEETNPVIFTSVIIALLCGFYSWGNSIKSYEPKASDPIEHPAGTLVVEISDSLSGISFLDSRQSILAVSKDHQFEIFKASYALKQPEGELVSSRNTFYNKDIWSFTERATVSLSNDTNATEISLVNSQGNFINLIYWYCVGDYCSSNSLNIKLKIAYHLLFDSGVETYVTTVSSNILNVKELREIAKYNYLTLDN